VHRCTLLDIHDAATCSPSPRLLDMAHFYTSAVMSPAELPLYISAPSILDDLALIWLTG
jgi:hypothetical protein